MSDRWGQDPLLEHTELPASIAPFIAALRRKPNFALEVANLINWFDNKLSPEEKLNLALHARGLAPYDPHVWRLTKSVVNASIPHWHFAIATDQNRNEIYDKAINACINDDSVVLEIGTGSGILALMAARAGARHVYTIEINPVIARAAKINIAANGYADRITVIAANAMTVGIGDIIPQRCNVLLHEIISNDLFGEDMTKLIGHARKHLLTEDALHLPDRMWATGRVVEYPKPKSQAIGTQMGFDLSAMDLAQSPQLFTKSATDIEKPLTDAVEIMHVVSNADSSYAADIADFHIPVTTAGRANAFQQWIGFSFPDGTIYSNEPPQPSCWDNVIHPFVYPRDVTPGNSICIRRTVQNMVMSIQDIRTD